MAIEELMRLNAIIETTHRGRRGGARPNSGPKKGAKYRPTLEKELAREQVRNFVTMNLRPILERLLQAAEDGDTAAAKLLLEHGIGRPVDTLALQAADSGFTTINIDI